MEAKYEKIVREGYELGTNLELLTGISFEEFKTEVEKKFKPNIKELAEKYENSRDEDLLERDKEINSWYRETKDTEYYLRVVVRQSLLRFAYKNNKIFEINIHGADINGQNVIYADLLGSLQKKIPELENSGVKYEDNLENPVIKSINIEINNKSERIEIDLYKPYLFIKYIEDKFLDKLNGYRFVELFKTLALRTYILIPANSIEDYEDNIFIPYQFNHSELPKVKIHPVMKELWHDIYKFGCEVGLINHMDFDNFYHRIDASRVEHFVKEVQRTWNDVLVDLWRSNKQKKIEKELFIVQYAREIFGYLELLRVAKEAKNIMIFPKNWNIDTVICQINDNNPETTIKLLSTTNNFNDGNIFIELQVGDHIEKAEVNQQKPQILFDLLNKNLQNFQYIQLKKNSNTYEFARIKKDKVKQFKENKFIK